ncbi:diaminobutyrate acetyltransferase [Sphingopyxis sp.]|uniref:diaminobutyrate acetyltransferase n=1 Tax=Sphingopyxis sp. TaxID=1908224 RepID=UPI003F72BDC9
MPSEKEAGVPSSPAGFAFRAPVATDGPVITALISRCPPLDRNSAYCNLIQSTHFADHCVVAQQGERIVGWVSGHRPPSDPASFFVWQVAVASEGRGQGLAKRMIKSLLARPAQRGVTSLTTTVTEDNKASWALFHSLARDWNAPLERAALFERDAHFAGAYPTEYEARIGPFDLKKIKEAQG